MAEETTYELVNTAGNTIASFATKADYDSWLASLDEEPRFEIMERLIGWCGPHARLSLVGFNSEGEAVDG